MVKIDKIPPKNKKKNPIWDPTKKRKIFMKKKKMYEFSVKLIIVKID